MLGEDVGGPGKYLSPIGIRGLRHCHEVGGEEYARYPGQAEQLLSHRVVGRLAGKKGCRSTHRLADTEFDRIGIGG